VFRTSLFQLQRWEQALMRAVSATLRLLWHGTSHARWASTEWIVADEKDNFMKSFMNCQNLFNCFCRTSRYELLFQPILFYTVLFLFIINSYWPISRFCRAIGPLCVSVMRSGISKGVWEPWPQKFGLAARLPPSPYFSYTRPTTCHILRNSCPTSRVN